MTTNVRLGALLKQLRKSRNFSQKDVSQRSGVSVPMLSLIEGGKRGASISLFDKVCRVYGLTYEIALFRATRCEDLKVPSANDFQEAHEHMKQIIDEIFNIKIYEQEPVAKECPECDGSGKLNDSPCCGASYDSDILICMECKEHIGEDDLKCESCDGKGTL